MHITRLAAAAALLLLAACDTAPSTTPSQALDPALTTISAPLPDPATLAGSASDPLDPRRAGSHADSQSAVSTPLPRKSGASDRADHPSASDTSGRRGQSERGSGRPDGVDARAVCGFGIRFGGMGDDSPEARICRAAHG
ncbi:hypothetical protein [Embleya sp. AB8]|uniref:hypothetical protein n=1 Tax=Embleya sp. AB8 TaxID=3156304 RepID=UPI003C714FDB